MERNVRVVLFSLIFILGLMIGLFGGVILDRQVLSVFVPLEGIPSEAEGQFKLMAEAWNTIQQMYVDRTALDPTRLIYGAIGGMVDALGDTGHSRFLSPDLLNQENSQLQAAFEGIGATVQQVEDQIVIVAPMDGSPAQQAGLKAGDVILKADDVELTGMDLTDAVSHILGPAGTQVTLTIFSPETGETREVTLTRAKIEVKNVTWQAIPGTDLALVRITVFSERVTEDLSEALKEITDQGYTGMILDLRNNPGGLLDEAIGVSSQFLKDGTILRVRSADQSESTYDVEPGGLGTEIPLVVLINQGSASASEIVSGAIQDHDRAVLIGEQTFGTGTVLNQFPLSDGSALLLATQEWLTPSGRVIWHQGIAPDEVVSLPVDVFPTTPDLLRDMSEEDLKASQDAQLLRAIEVLQGQE